MITGINCWARHGRVTALAHLDYQHWDGEQAQEFCHLSVLFDDTGPFAVAKDFDEDVVNVELPRIHSAYPALLDTWLRDYARKLDGFVGEFGVPKPRAPA